MNILFISAEVTPFAKAGGLADVVGALPVALRRLGLDVRIMMPKYEHLAGDPSLDVVIENAQVTINGKTESVRVYRSTLPKSDIEVYFLENDTYLSRGAIYDEHGVQAPFFELQRFLFFTQACITIIPQLSWKPDILHCHDWHTALIPSLASFTRGLVGVKTLLTIHNLAHQGVWNRHDVLSFLGLHEQSHENYQITDRHGDFNILQQGILAASAVNTVSPRYAQEILTPEYGEKLEETLAKKHPPVQGILNGIDINTLNPQTDSHLRVQYDQNSLSRKKENVLALHEECGFVPHIEAPTFAFIGRLADQKGVDLILRGADTILENGGRLIVLGSGQPALEQALGALAGAHPDQVFFKSGYDPVFAQKLYAGADIMLVPSKFEPCGLVQLVAMRYGTVPLVRATGGLLDSVPDVEKDPKHGLGITFQAFSVEAFTEAVRRARRLFENKAQWELLIRRDMEQNFSWDRSARDYLRLYESI